MNFLAAHDCGVEFREFRVAASEGSSSERRPAAAGAAESLVA
jgi:hypothetical protein